MQTTIGELLQRAITLHRRDEIGDAEILYQRILEFRPDHPDANHNLGVLKVTLGCINDALPLFKRALDFNPQIEQFWFSYIEALVGAGYLDDAKILLENAKQSLAPTQTLDAFVARLRNELEFPAPLSSTTTDVTKSTRAPRPLTSRPAASRRAGEKLLPSEHNLGHREGETDPIAAQSVNWGAYYHKVKELYSARDYDQAAEISKAALKEFPEIYELWEMLGASNIQIGDLEEASIAFEQAISIKPHVPQGHNNLGLTYRERGKWGEAVTAFETATRLDPRFSEAWINLSSAYKAVGMLDRAETSLRKSLNVKADNPRAYSDLGMLLGELERIPEAIACHEKAVELSPKWSAARNNLGVTLRDAGSLESAIEQFCKACELDPTSLMAHCNYAVALCDCGDYEGAQRIIQVALRIEPDSHKANSTAGTILFESGQAADAIVHYRRALMAQPDHYRTYLNLGLALQAEGLLDEAIDANTKAIGIKPDYSEALNNLGVLYREIGQWSSAASCYEQAIDADPFYAEAHYNMGNALREGGALSEAVEHYQQAIKLNPQYMSAYRVALSMRTFPVTEKITKQLKSLWRGGEISGTALSELGFALYLCCKRGNQNKEAFEYLLQANKNQRSIDKYDVDQDRKFFKHLQSISSSWLDCRLPDKNSSPLPIFVIGMPRSGTTLVEQILSSHSKVTGLGELPFAAKILGDIFSSSSSPSRHASRKLRDEYLSMLSNRYTGAYYFVDKMPENFRFVPMLAAAFPRAKFVHVHRNPAATCWSAFERYFPNGVKYSYSLSDTVEYYNLYADLMSFYHDICGADIFPLDYDALTTNVDREVGRLADWLKLGNEHQMTTPHLNQAPVKTASSEQVRQPIYSGSSKKWKTFEPFLAGAFDSLVEFKVLNRR
jgi:tetratricopeptide (TPR) repeat protein